MEEIHFNKYESKGGAYHWEEVSSSLRRHNAFTRARYQVVANLLNDVENKWVLDIGCGDGVLSYMAAEKGGRVVGIDLSDLALKAARRLIQEKGNVVLFQVASAYCLPFADGWCDVVIAADVIEHLQQSEMLLQEMKRVLRPGGRGIIATPIKPSDPPDKMHVKEYDPAEFEALLRGYFDRVRILQSHPLFLRRAYLREFRWCGNRPLWRYLINALSICVYNPFLLHWGRRFANMVGVVEK